jgi:hypothetical protein
MLSAMLELAVLKGGPWLGQCYYFFSIVQEKVEGNAITNTHTILPTVQQLN